MASTLPYVSSEDLDDLERELRATKPGWSPDIGALEISILLDLILAFRQGQIVGCAPPELCVAAPQLAGGKHLQGDAKEGRK